MLCQRDAAAALSPRDTQATPNTRRSTKIGRANFDLVCRRGRRKFYEQKRCTKKCFLEPGGGAGRRRYDVERDGGGWRQTASWYTFWVQKLIEGGHHLIFCNFGPIFGHYGFMELEPCFGFRDLKKVHKVASRVTVTAAV
jgi:hypothetical protein